MTGYSEHPRPCWWRRRWRTWSPRRRRDPNPKHPPADRRRSTTPPPASRSSATSRGRRRGVLGSARGPGLLGYRRWGWSRQRGARAKRASDRSADVRLPSRDRARNQMGKRLRLAFAGGTGVFESGWCAGNMDVCSTFDCFVAQRFQVRQR